MDDLTSGFNIGTNYSLSPKFNEMIGFTEDEVRQMLTYYSTTYRFNHSIDELIRILKLWYNNYCFAEECYGEMTLYISNMVLYFVKNYLELLFIVSGNFIPSLELLFLHLALPFAVGAGFACPNTYGEPFSGGQTPPLRQNNSATGNVK